MASSLLLTVGASLYFVVLFSVNFYTNFRIDIWHRTKYISLDAISYLFLGFIIAEASQKMLYLTSSTLVCVVMANSMPSFCGVFHSLELVLVVGAFVFNMINLHKTDITYFYWKEQIVVTVIMFLQMLFIISASVVVPTIKKIMERKFHAKLTKHNNQFPAVERVNHASEIKEIIIKYWFMAYTSNPQNVIARSFPCIASNSLCLVTVGVTMVRVWRNLSYKNFWTIYDEFNLVHALVICETLAIIVGSIVPASRCMWWSEVFFHNNELRIDWNNLIRDIIEVEDYWVSELVKWMEAPPHTYFEEISTRKTIRNLKLCLLILVKSQMGIVMVSKLISALSIIPMFLLGVIVKNITFALISAGCIYLTQSVEVGTTLVVFLLVIGTLIVIFYIENKNCFKHNALISIKYGHQHSSCDDYFLHLEGEARFVRFITWKERLETPEGNCHEKTAVLKDMIKRHFTLPQRFEFITFPYKENVPSHPDLFRRSWTLRLVTLTCIAVTLPGFAENNAELLLKGVDQGFRYATLLDNSSGEEELINMAEAAESVWVGINVDKKWLHLDLQTCIPPDQNSAREVVQRLMEIARERVPYLTDANDKPYQWSRQELVASCMQKVCSTILQNYDEYVRNMTLFEWLERTISIILGACLENLPVVIRMEYDNKSIEVREEGVWKAANIFSETERLLNMFYKEQSYPLVC